MKKSDCAPAAKSVTAAATVRKATGAKRAVGVRKAPVAGAPKIAQAAKPAKPATVVAPVVKPTSVSAGMRIAIDPETHLPIKPSAGQRTAPVGTEGATPAADSKSEVTVTVLPNGTRLVTLGESLMQYSVARRDPSGRLRFDCASSADEARKLAAKPAKPAATVAVEK